MKEEIAYMIDRFPRHKHEILKAYDDSEEFKVLCLDFYTSAKAIENFRQDRIKNRRGEFEYQQVFADLEKEIVKYLNSGNRR